MLNVYSDANNCYKENIYISILSKVIFYNKYVLNVGEQNSIKEILYIFKEKSINNI